MRKEKDIAIKVNRVHKTFRLPSEKASGLKQAFIHRVKGVKGYTNQKVLRGIDFEVQKGDFFGIVGRNGSGKSTLLKIIAGIYQPTEGSVQINGSMVSFIELGVGFNPELTGRENVYLNGALLGFSAREIDSMYDEIVDFAELHDFMEQKLKNYSSGMQVRLAFSCAIKARSDILILDEVLAVGDEAFQRKCSDYFEQIKKDKKQTVILVTHNMSAVRKYCNKAILIRGGGIASSGRADAVADEYTKENSKVNKKTLAETGRKNDFGAQNNNDIVSLKVTPVSKTILDSDDLMAFDIEYKIADERRVVVCFSIIDDISGRSIIDNQSPVISGRGKHSLRYSVPLNDHFNNITLRVVATIRDAKMHKQHDVTMDKTSLILAATNEYSESCFHIRNKNGQNYAILNNAHAAIAGEFSR